MEIISNPMDEEKDEINTKKSNDDAPAEIENQVRMTTLPKQLPEWDSLPVENDSWYIVHSALRLDMEDFEKALETLKERIEDGSVADFMFSNIKIWFTHFAENTHKHHDNEELIFFPAIRAKTTMPEKMALDHPHLIALLNEVTELVRNLGNVPENERLSKAKATLEKFKEFHREMAEHLKEEETVGIPIVRAHFTMKEIEALEKKITKGEGKFVFAWFLRSLSDDEKRKFMTERAKIPGIVISLLLWNTVKKGGKYDKKYTRLLDEIQSGTKTSESCKCF